MLALFSIVISDDKERVVSEGSLITLPPELKDNFRIEKYSKIVDHGWTTTEFGYAAYVRVDDDGNRYILPGLYLTDYSAPKKKFHGYKPILSKQQVESYLEQHLGTMTAIQVRYDTELTMLVHDLRHLSSSIYHSAIEAETAHKDGNRRLVFDNINTVIATQTMLKVRIDYLDFANKTDRFDDLEKIPVYSRVDKVVRCFRASAASKRIDIVLSGESYRLAEGPNILDIVPYTLIDNAIKYSPPGEPIYVNVQDTDTETTVSIISIGPKIEDAERERIFSRGFRGRHAIQYRNSGTGLGLSIAKEIISIFSGQISVASTATTDITQNIEFEEIRFSFVVPTAGEDAFRKQKSSWRR